MGPHERNPICIKDSEHLAELIKVRFDASDARQEEIKTQVVYTNGRTRKLEDYHLEQIAWNREQSVINKELLESIVLQKKYNEEKDRAAAALEKDLTVALFMQRNWIAIATIFIAIISIYVTTKSDKNESTKQYQQPNSGQHIQVDRNIDGSTGIFRDYCGTNTTFRVY